LESARILEMCVARFLSTGREPPASMWKNLGLAYAKIVQKQLPCDEATHVGGIAMFRPRLPSLEVRLGVDALGTWAREALVAVKAAVGVDGDLAAVLA